METTDERTPRNLKIVPEWRVQADDQIVLVAFVALLAILGGLAWQTWWNGGSAGDAAAAVTMAGTSTAASIDTDGLARVAADYDIRARADGARAILTGTVESAQLRNDASLAAAAVAGVSEVDNRLRLSGEIAAAPTSEAAATATTEPAPTATTSTTEATTTTAAPTTEAATTAPPTSAAAELNAALDQLVNLSPIQFETSTNDITAAGLEVVDQAASLLSQSAAPVEIQGYTDVRGTDRVNAELSQARADAVKAALMERGIAAERLTAVGKGETTEFGEALEANRRVQFVVS